MNNDDLRSYNALKRLKMVSLVNGLLIFKDDGFKGIAKKIKVNKNKDAYLKKVPKLKFEQNKVIIIIDEHLKDNEIIEKLSNSEYKYQIFKIYKGSKGDNKKVNYITKIQFERIFKYKSFIFISKKKVNLAQYYYGFNIINNQELKNEIETLINSMEGLKLLANYNNSNNITTKTSTFFNYEGTNYYSGGAERYLIDLHDVCKNKGINLDIYQNANKPFFRKYHGINVIGLSHVNEKLVYNDTFYSKQSKNYADVTESTSQLHIYSAFNEGYPVCAKPSIGISHGISWDHKGCAATDGISFWREKQMFIESALACDKLVSVDTNTANWFQTIDYKLGNQKTKVIPNYVDTKEFNPRKDYLKPKDKIVITYPRRLYEPRGLYLALNVADRILNKYKNVEFHFVGKGFEEDLNKIAKVQEKWPKKVFCYSKSPFEMHEVYKQSDISLIPTLYSEGTSLSCLEAMASGNVVVSTRIGGLTDLILNGYNGYLIEPEEESLYDTIEYIINNYSEMGKIKKRAVEVAKSFNKDIWKERWDKTLDTFNLKTKNSANIGLVEFYLKDINDISEKCKKKIKEELKNNNLIYLRVENYDSSEKITGGLLQVVSMDEEKVSTPDKIYISRELAKKYNSIKNKEII